jgi:cytochrome c peroxidase
VKSASEQVSAARQGKVARLSLRRFAAVSERAAQAACLGFSLLGAACEERVARGVPGPAKPAAHEQTVPRAHAPELSLLARVGKRLFFDPNLSASGKMSCATCHDPDHAYGPTNDLAVQLGGPRGDQAGGRAVPSLRYKEYTPPYADLLDNPDGMSAPGPGGGFAWDGRVDTLAEQAKLPLLSPVEMANKTPDEVVLKIRAASYAVEFERAVGHEPWGDPAAAFRAALAALQAFQLEDPSFHPYTSKFDLHASNKLGGEFTLAEQRGLKVFADPKLGNCASCHFTGAGLSGSSGLFTDFSYEAIGVPRNAALPSNQDASYFDLGVCGPLRADHPALVDAPNTFCGMFKTPTLRNTTNRRVFFHNGVMHSLEQVVRFYNTRDTRPELWYPNLGGTPKPKNDANFPSYGLVTRQYVGGTTQKYDDLPARHRHNIDPQMPLDGRKPGSKEPLSEQNITDLLCFLNTLNDDYTPPATPPSNGPCVH